MPATPLVALRNDITDGNALVVVGTGVSVAVSGGAPTASWRGLIESGIERAAAYDSRLTAEWKANVKADLDVGQLLSAADKVTDALDGQTSGSFKQWLRDDIGQLPLQHPELLQALDSLRCPLATTNYDHLIENQTGRAATNWLEPTEIQMVLRGEERSVVHLHGEWRRAESIVLGRASYAQLAGDRAATDLVRAIASVKSLVFVGCGDGLADPHFRRLRNWLKTVFADSENQHYRLCVADELDQLTSEHQGERIIPVSYGNQHSELVPFLLELAPIHTPGATLVGHGTAARRGVDAIVDRVRSESVIAEYAADAEARPMAELLIPPVLLPVSHEQFVSARKLDLGEPPKRCDPAADLTQHPRLLIAAEELGGLTTALEWCLAEAHRLKPDLVPVLVDFRSLGQGRGPLEREVRKQLMQAGALARPKDPLPPIALGLDNLLSKPQRTFARALAELQALAPAQLLLGCRQGVEAELVEALEANRLRPVVRYVGRINTRDAERMAALVEPAQAVELAEKAMEILRREHLPRTPMTVGLLLSVLLHGKSMLATASETALLDAYVGLLLGRGDPHDDARVGLDEAERADILGTLASAFVRHNTGSQPESEVLGILARYFDEVDWQEDPMEVLTGLKKRHLVSLRGGQVHFAQSSYLHLFAAKHAAIHGPEGDKFRELLYARPLYYSQIIRHYAALTRNDAEVLRRVGAMLEPVAERTTRGRSFSVVVPADPPPPPSIDELLDRLTPPSAEVGGEISTDVAPPIDDLFYLDDADPSPFPAADPENVPKAVQLFTLVMLASNVLRDSELVKDVALKQKVLSHALGAWATLVELLEQDADIASLMRTVAETVFKALGAPENKLGGLVDEFVADAPVLMAFGGMSATLASRKLSRALDTCMGDVAFTSEPANAAMGALLALAILHVGWAQTLQTLQRQHPGITASRTAIKDVALKVYQTEGHRPEDERALEDFLLDQLVQDLSLADPAEEKRARTQLLQRLTKGRLVAVRRQVLAEADIETDA